MATTAEQPRERFTNFTPYEMKKGEEYMSAEMLQHFDKDDYGFCDQCGVEIGIRRLEARPTATLCIDCKTLAEIRERQTGI